MRWRFWGGGILINVFTWFNAAGVRPSAASSGSCDEQWVVKNYLCPVLNRQTRRPLPQYQALFPSPIFDREPVSVMNIPKIGRKKATQRLSPRKKDEVARTSGLKPQQQAYPPPAEELSTRSNNDITGWRAYFVKVTKNLSLGSKLLLFSGGGRRKGRGSGGGQAPLLLSGKSVVPLTEEEHQIAVVNVERDFIAERLGGRTVSRGVSKYPGRAGAEGGAGGGSKGRPPSLTVGGEADLALADPQWVLENRGKIDLFQEYYDFQRKAAEPPKGRRRRAAAGFRTDWLTQWRDTAGADDGGMRGLPRLSALRQYSTSSRLPRIPGLRLWMPAPMPQPPPPRPGISGPLPPSPVLVAALIAADAENPFWFTDPSLRFAIGGGLEATVINFPGHYETPVHAGAASLNASQLMPAAETYNVLYFPVVLGETYEISLVPADNLRRKRFRILPCGTTDLKETLRQNQVTRSPLETYFKRRVLRNGFVYPVDDFTSDTGETPAEVEFRVHPEAYARRELEQARATVPLRASKPPKRSRLLQLKEPPLDSLPAKPSTIEAEFMNVRSGQNLLESALHAAAVSKLDFERATEVWDEALRRKMTLSAALRAQAGKPVANLEAVYRHRARLSWYVKDALKRSDLVQLQRLERVRARAVFGELSALLDADTQRGMHAFLFERYMPELMFRGFLALDTRSLSLLQRLAHRRAARGLVLLTRAGPAPAAGPGFWAHTLMQLPAAKRRVILQDLNEAAGLNVIAEDWEAAAQVLPAPPPSEVVKQVLRSWSVEPAGSVQVLHEMAKQHVELPWWVWEVPTAERATIFCRAMDEEKKVKAFLFDRLLTPAERLAFAAEYPEDSLHAYEYYDCGRSGAAGGGAPPPDPAAVAAAIIEPFFSAFALRQDSELRKSVGQDEERDALDQLFDVERLKKALPRFAGQLVNLPVALPQALLALAEPAVRPDHAIFSAPIARRWWRRRPSPLVFDRRLNLLDDGANQRGVCFIGPANVETFEEGSMRRRARKREGARDEAGARRFELSDLARVERLVAAYLMSKRTDPDRETPLDAVERVEANRAFIRRAHVDRAWRRRREFLGRLAPVSRTEVERRQLGVLHHLFTLASGPGLMLDEEDARRVPGGQAARLAKSATAKVTERPVTPLDGDLDFERPHPTRDRLLRQPLAESTFQTLVHELQARFEALFLLQMEIMEEVYYDALRAVKPNLVRREINASRRVLDWLPQSTRASGARKLATLPWRALMQLAGGATSAAADTETRWGPLSSQIRAIEAEMNNRLLLRKRAVYTELERQLYRGAEALAGSAPLMPPRRLDRQTRQWVQRYASDLAFDLQRIILITDAAADDAAATAAREPPPDLPQWEWMQLRAPRRTENGSERRQAVGFAVDAREPYNYFFSGRVDRHEPKVRRAVHGRSQSLCTSGVSGCG